MSKYWWTRQYVCYNVLKLKVKLYYIQTASLVFIFVLKGTPLFIFKKIFFNGVASTHALKPLHKQNKCDLLTGNFYNPKELWVYILMHSLQLIGNHVGLFVFNVKTPGAHYFQKPLLSIWNSFVKSKWFLTSLSKQTLYYGNNHDVLLDISALNVYCALFVWHFPWLYISLDEQKKLTMIPKPDLEGCLAFSRFRFWYSSSKSGR